MVESAETRGTFLSVSAERKAKCGNFLNNVIVYIYDSNNRKGGTHIEVTAFNISFQYLFHTDFESRGRSFHTAIAGMY